MKRTRFQDYPRTLPIIAALVWALLVGVELYGPALADPPQQMSGSLDAQSPDLMTAAEDAVCIPGADLDGNGRVDSSDLFDLLGQWGPFGDEAGCAADLDGDGGVDVGDILSLLADWGEIPIE